ncbi:hypothetical protein SLITK23_74830 [Streptomyces lividans]|uniref:3-oxoacyl-(Acyl-carrier protein) reductase n=2 Tax=Streptomyces lividans TaxID=1916 RepID=A0A7U9DYW0_STRLI|nr:SDR family oxidoreductase [Streptomyces lividans]EOY52696.1 3-oxoacyl-(acyl-carrier protein) reductase [Streptomyces lividans 1326]KKD14102.1 short-chain dehydrogenase [Streptomyces sp. WM6391]AIJ11134.1 short-chain dehydrogenase/reductase [Streptomyces lividans TK24]EFD64440.1 short-chain dehydrogenase/reductase [Streptomyces lividans TK24]QSJ06636.1 short-chain dehydrogenase/reductase [Streptomyces lividans]
MDVSSIAGQLPQRTEASHAAAKAALNTYSRELATEVGEHGVRVVCVLPGFVVTDGATAHLRRMAEKQGMSTEAVTQQIVDDLKVPLGRSGAPGDVADMIDFLASDRAKWLTGAQFRVDGGILPTAFSAALSTAPPRIASSSLPACRWSSCSPRPDMLLRAGPTR